MTHIDARNRFARTAMALVLGAALAAPAFAAQSIYDTINASAASSPITVKALRGGVSMIDGSGGNIGVLPDKDGAFMVDAGIALSKTGIENALKSVNAGKVHYVVNTHWHWDHADGNAWLHDEKGATVVASPETAKHLDETIRVNEWDHTFTPVAKSGVPTVLVSRDKTFQVGGETVQVLPFADSHTDGDLVVRFKKADVIFSGDIYWNGIYPFIDHYEKGSIDGTIEAATRILKMAGPNTIIVPGHGPSGGSAELTAYRDMLVSVRDKVKALKDQGKTVEEVIAAHPTASFDATWSKGIVSPDIFVSLVYRGV